MSPADRFEVVLLLIAACVGLTLVAKHLRLPQAGALIVGGLLLALIPGMPSVTIDPDLVLVLFLPPLLLLSAYLTDWRAFRADLRIILQLAVGAVLFTTLVVGLVAHLVVPTLPWAACFALGAIVSPPDAVAAKAVLQGLPLPRRTITLLEGESLLNDASGLVLYRISVVAALTGTFDSFEAAGSFGMLVIGGVIVGVACGFAASFAIGRILEGELGVATSFLAAWGSYILGERLHLSGVLATVACGIVMGLRQHAVLDAEQRLQSQAVWRTIGFVLESLVFILIGLSLRSVVDRLAGGGGLIDMPLMQAGAIVAAVIVARFAWIIPTAYGTRALFPALRRNDPYPSLRILTVMSWAGMRGVVSLAAALALPAAFPGRDFILLSTFAVILVTVLVQGATLAPMIRLMRLETLPPVAEWSLTEGAARREIVAAQLKAIEQRSRKDDGTHDHPRLVEQFQFRLAAISRAVDAGGALEGVRTEHFGALLAGVNAGRQELLRLHRSGEISNDVLRALERELDADEIRSTHLLRTDTRLAMSSSARPSTYED